MSQSFEQFGKYILLEKLAAGGMAEVYFAKSTGAVGVSKFMAIKRILPQFSENPEFVEMFKEEAKLAVNLNHSNIVSIYDFGIEKNQFYIVMDYVEGKNLRQVNNEFKKQNKALSIEDVVYIIKEAAAGLDHAHRCVDAQTGKPLNIIHRDISPQNIMVSFEGEVKLIDFGIAKAETQMEATKAGTLKGKFGYMSPEQADGQPIDARTDVFSLGIVLWELLANERLFTASNEAAILNKIRTCQIPPIRKLCPNAPMELEKIVNKALAKDRGLRYESAAALHRDLNRFLNLAYPEFSPQEFSKTLKNSFADEFLALQKKRIEYSKIQIQEPEEKTQAVNTVTDVRPPTTPNKNNLNFENIEEPGIDLDVATKLKVDLSEMKSKKSSSIQDGHTKSVTHKSTTGTGNSSVTGITKTATNISSSPVNKTAANTATKEKSSSGLMTAMLFTLFIVASGYFGIQEGYFQNLHPSINSVLKKFNLEKGLPALPISNPSNEVVAVATPPPSANPPPKEEKADFSSTAPAATTTAAPTKVAASTPTPTPTPTPPPPRQKMRIIYLKSAPTGASITVNGQPYVGRTPSHVRVVTSPNQEDVIVISKEGFSSKIIRFPVNDQTGVDQDHTLSLTLEPEAMGRVVFRNAAPYEVIVFVRKAGDMGGESYRFKLGVNERRTTNLKTGSYEVRMKSDLFGESQIQDLEVLQPKNSMDETYYEVKEK